MYDILPICGILVIVYNIISDWRMGAMPRGTNQKFKLYRLAQIMLERTDDDHYITMPEIKISLFYNRKFLLPEEAIIKMPA